MSSTLDNNQHSFERRRRTGFQPVETELPFPDVPDSNQREPSSPQIDIIVDPGVVCRLPSSRLRQAAVAAAAARGFTVGEIGIRVTNDQSIRDLNSRHLNHDYETDVISFSYDCRGNGITGELVVSVDTARRRASELGWNEGDELLLYVVHGVLHLTGMDDQEPNDRAQMRRLEREVMLSLGVDEIIHFGADISSDRESKGSSEASA